MLVAVVVETTDEESLLADLLSLIEDELEVTAGAEVVAPVADVNPPKPQNAGALSFADSPAAERHWQYCAEHDAWFESAAVLQRLAETGSWQWQMLKMVRLSQM